MSEQDKVQKEFKKTFQTVAYNDEDTSMSEEDFTAELTGEPTNQTESVENKRDMAVIDLGGDKIEFEVRYNHIPDMPDGYEGTFSDWEGDTFENFKRDENQNGTGRLSLETKSETKTQPVCSMGKATSNMIDHMVEENGITQIEPGLEYSPISRRWSSDDVYDSVRVSSFSIGKQRILSKEAERQSDDLYQTVADYPCFNMTVEMQSDDESMFDTWNEQVIVPLHKWLAKQPAVGVVRYMSCEIQETRKGECYNI